MSDLSRRRTPVVTVCRRVELDVPRGLHGPAIARRLVRDQLDAEVAPCVLADVELIVSELVTNAVVHGAGAIRLELVIDRDAIRGEVIDQGPGFAIEVRERGVEAISGRGLWLVSSLARRWGVRDGSSHVWFELG